MYPLSGTNLGLFFIHDDRIGAAGLEITPVAQVEIHLFQGNGYQAGIKNDRFSADLGTQPFFKFSLLALLAML